MPRYGPWDIPDHVYNTIIAGAREYDVPSGLALSVAGHESGCCGWCSAIGDKNHPQEGDFSAGLFQLHKRGVGAGYSLEDLLDCATNTRIAMRRMAAGYAKEGTWLGAISPWSVKYLAMATWGVFGNPDGEGERPEKPPDETPEKPPFKIGIPAGKVGPFDLPGFGLDLGPFVSTGIKVALSIPILTLIILALVAPLVLAVLRQADKVVGETAPNITEAVA